MDFEYIKKNIFQSNEDFHSSYLFFTMALDFCIKKLEEVKKYADDCSNDYHQGLCNSQKIIEIINN